MKKIITASVAALALVACDPEPTYDNNKSVTDYNDNDIADMVFDSMWDRMSSSERADLCDAYRGLGPRLAFESFDEGAGGTFTFSQFTNFFDGVC